MRVGAPLRPEFAAWRYGDQFGRRRRRRLLVAGGVSAAAGLIAFGLPLAGLGLGPVARIISLATTARRSRKQILLSEGQQETRISALGADRTRLLHTGPGRFELRVPVLLGPEFDVFSGRYSSEEPTYRTFAEDAALRVASRLLPHVNRTGGSADDVRSAVATLETTGSARALFGAVAANMARYRSGWGWAWGERLHDSALGSVFAHVRLALEMALHEEQERRAMAGDLAPLERAWREAEEVAAIADDLLLPDDVGAKLGALKARRDAPSGGQDG